MTNPITHSHRSPLRLSEQTLLDVAIGADPLHVIAARNGMDELELEALLLRPDVKKAVEVRQAELANKGEFFKLKARALAEDLIEAVYLDARRTPDPKVRLDAVKFLAMAGGVDKPEQTRQVGNGRQVSINIDLGSAGRATVQLDFRTMFGEELDELRSNDDLVGDYTEVDE